MAVGRRDRRSLRRYRLLLCGEPQRRRSGPSTRPPPWPTGSFALPEVGTAEGQGRQATTAAIARSATSSTATAKPSARDNFDIGFPVTEDDPEVKAGTPLYAPNIWPDMPGFRGGDRGLLRRDVHARHENPRRFCSLSRQAREISSPGISPPVADMVINHYLGAAGLHISDQASGRTPTTASSPSCGRTALGGLEVMGKDGQWIVA